MEDGRRLSFGSVAEEYDAARPSYPGALIDDLLALAPVAAGRRVLEAGAGTGKATVLLAERGAGVLALEPDPEMAAIARRNTVRHDGVTVVESEFEAWDPQGERFPLLVSAQAWHWMDPATRYVRARTALDDGGLLAVFWNIPDWERTDLAGALEAAYEGIAFAVVPGPMHPQRGATPGIRPGWEREVAGAEGFGGADVRHYRWEHEHTAEEYVRLIATHSDHIRLDPGERARLAARVRAAIDAAGGTLRLAYVTRLCLARAR